MEYFSARLRLSAAIPARLSSRSAMVPLALGLNEGGEAQAPMARAVIGGLISSTFITLLIVPVVYSFFEGRKSG